MGTRSEAGGHGRGGMANGPFAATPAQTAWRSHTGPGWARGVCSPLLPAYQNNAYGVESSLFTPVFNYANFLPMRRTIIKHFSFTFEKQKIT